MVPVARRNLLAEKGRFAMSTCGVALAVLLILVVVSLYRGWSHIGSVYLGFPGSLWVAQAGTSDPFHSTSLLPAGQESRLARIPGVVAAIPVYARHLAFPVRHGTLDAYAMAFAIPSGLPLPPGTESYEPPPGQIVVDRVLAGAAGVSAGGWLDVLGHRLLVRRVLSGGNAIVNFAYLNPADGAGLLGYPGHVSYYLLVTTRGADTALIGRAAAAALPGSEVHTSTEFADAFNRLVNSGFLDVVGVLVAIGFVVGAAVIALTTFTATVEKARDFGVLKAIGAPTTYLYRIVVWQSLIVGATGSLLGVTAAVVVTSLVTRWVPEFVTDLRPVDVVLVLALALLMALGSSLVPVRRLNRIDPAMVFRA